MRAPLAFPIVLVVALATTAIAAPARAADEAEAAIHRGVELRRHARDQEALEEFRKAYALVKSPRALAQIALAEQALGRWADAESDLEQAMESRTDAWIRKNIATLNGALEIIRRHLGSLDVIGPAGAELRVDGRVLGTLPLKKPARAPIGSLTVEVRKEGFFPATRPVSIAAGELTRESVDLQPLPAAPAVPRPTTAPETHPSEANRPGGALPAIPGGPETTPGQPGGRPDEPTAHRGGWQRTLAWSTAVGALVAAGGGVAALLIRNAKLTDASGLSCRIGNGTVNPPDAANAPRCLSLANSADQARVGAVVAFSLAGALAITSTLLFVTSSPQSAASSSATETARRSAHLVCAPTLALPGAACQLRF